MPTLTAFVLVPLLALTGCDGGSPSAPETPPDQTYTVEGAVETLPREGADRRELSIAHEEILEFLDREGQRVGMHAMTMQFEVADGVSLEGVDVGDRVHFTFEVRWDARPMLRVTRLEKL